jgi:hypothetical protein
MRDDLARWVPKDERSSFIGIHFYKNLEETFLFVNKYE